MSEQENTNTFQKYADISKEMLERVKGSDAEIIWMKLHRLITKINCLSNEQQNAITSTMQRLTEKIQYLMNLSIQNDASSRKTCNTDQHQASFVLPPVATIPTSTQNKFKSKKHRRWKRQASYAMMSPRRDTAIPKIKIKLSEILKIKKKKEEKRKHRKEITNSLIRTESSNHASMVQVANNPEGIKDNNNQPIQTDNKTDNIAIKSKSKAVKAVTGNQETISEFTEQQLQIDDKINTNRYNRKFVNESVKKVSLEALESKSKANRIKTPQNLNDNYHVHINVSETINNIMKNISTINDSNENDSVITSTSAITEIPTEEAQFIYINDDSDDQWEQTKTDMANSSTNITFIEAQMATGDLIEVSLETIQLPSIRKKSTEKQLDSLKNSSHNLNTEKRQTRSSLNNLKRNGSSKEIASYSKTQTKKGRVSNQKQQSNTALKRLLPDASNEITVIKQELVPQGFQSPAMIEIPTQIVIENIKKDNDMLLLSSEDTLKQIRPWIQQSEHRKYEINCVEMLSNGFCLSALFKCMGSNCAYFTRESSLFVKHLQSHHKYQSIDMKNFSRCAYCDTNNDDYEKLAEHIIQNHGYSRFQCAYCFYRSYGFHIQTHHQLYHMLKSEAVIACKPLATIDMKDELSKIWHNVYSVCKAIVCCVCKRKFYNIKHFSKHFSSYTIIPKTKCLKCTMNISKETVMDHLKNCHGFGDYNCSYCSFGSDSLDSIRVHLSNHHFDKPLLYFDRSLNMDSYKIEANGSTLSQPIVKCLALKQLVQQKPMSMKVIDIFNMEQEQLNFNNINVNLLH